MTVFIKKVLLLHTANSETVLRIRGGRQALAKTDGRQNGDT